MEKESIYEEENELRLDKTPADMIFHEYQLKGTSPPVYIHRTTDLTPVNDLVNKLERVLGTEESRRNRAWNDLTSELLGATQKMDKEQNYDVGPEAAYSHDELEKSLKKDAERYEKKESKKIYYSFADFVKKFHEEKNNVAKKGE